MKTLLRNLFNTVRSLCIASTSPLTHYVVVRADLPPGFQAAQIVHASGESAGSKLPPHTNAVVLVVDSESELIDLSDCLDGAGIRHHTVRETDEPFSGQFTAIGLTPVEDRRHVRPYLGKLRLLGS